MKAISLSVKCSDMFGADLIIDDKTVGGYNGYVPEWFPEGGGDYVDLEIDVETGRILNWTPPTQSQLDQTFKGEDSEEEAK